MTTPGHDQMQARGGTPGEHVVDSGFMPGDELIAARLRGITLLGPLRASRSAQVRAGGYAITSFTVDWDREQATCPQGVASSRRAPFTRDDGVQLIRGQFPARACRARPARAKCTTAARPRRPLRRPPPHAPRAAP